LTKEEEAKEYELKHKCCSKRGLRRAFSWPPLQLHDFNEEGEDHIESPL